MKHYYVNNSKDENKKTGLLSVVNTYDITEEYIKRQDLIPILYRKIR